MAVIIPAIDLRDGRCVRLVQGRLDEETVYSDDPAEVARGFAGAGAERIHVVDLDGAFEGLPRNLDAVRAVVDAVDVPVQMGGGMRSLAAVERVLESGVRWAILGTVAIENPELVAEACRRWPGRIIVGIDARDGRAAVRGWTEGTGEDAVALALRMKDLGVEEIVFTDIAKDGMLQGPNVAALRDMAERTGLRVIASGGVTTAKDVARVSAIGGVSGIIIGKALYEGTLTVADARAAAAGAGAPGGRLVVCLDVKDGRVVKGVRFADVQDVGDPAALAARYDEEGADELTVLNIGARPDNRDDFLHLIARIKAEIRMPLTAGGGVDSVEYAGRLLEAGADKVSVSSAAVRRPELLRELAEAFGRERVVLAVDCRRRAEPKGEGSPPTGAGGAAALGEGGISEPDRELAFGAGSVPGSDVSGVSAGWEVVVDGGRTPTGLDVLEWVQRAEASGAGEIVLNSIDGDGTGQGFDHALNRAVVERVSVPVTASGGVGALEHLRDGFVLGGVDGVLAASIFHFGGVTVGEAKRFLQAAGVPLGRERGATLDGNVGS